MLNKNIAKWALSLFLVVAVSLVSGLISSAWAIEKEDMPLEVNAFDNYVRFMPSCDVKTQSGELEIIKASSEYRHERKLFGKLPVEFAIEGLYINLDNSTSVKLPAHLTGLITSVDVTLPFFNLDKTYLRLGVEPSFYGDNWSAESSSFRIPSRVFAIYQPNDKLTLLLGVAVYPDYHHQVWPIVGLIYKPNDKLTFDLTPKRPNITYSFNEKLNVFAEGNLSYDEFEVEKGNLKNVVLEYTEAHVGAGIEYSLNKFIKASISGGGVFNRQLKYKDVPGKVAIKDGAYTEFRLEIKI